MHTAQGSFTGSKWWKNKGDQNIVCLAYHSILVSKINWLLFSQVLMQWMMCYLKKFVLQTIEVTLMSFIRCHDNTWVKYTISFFTEIVFLKDLLNAKKKKKKIYTLICFCICVNYFIKCTRFVLVFCSCYIYYQYYISIVSGVSKHCWTWWCWINVNELEYKSPFCCTWVFILSPNYVSMRFWPSSPTKAFNSLQTMVYVHTV